MSYCPTLPKDSDIITFLRALGIDWSTAPANWTNGEREEKIQEALENSLYREGETERGRRTSGGGGRKAEEGENEAALRVNLKRVFQEEGLLGYDPSLGTCTGKARGNAFYLFILRNQEIKVSLFILWRNKISFIFFVWLRLMQHHMVFFAFLPLFTSDLCLMKHICKWY